MPFISWSSLTVCQGIRACKVLTYSGLELHVDDGAPVTLVLARAVPELRDPALGRAVRAAGVHQPVDHQQRDHRVGVPVHRLEETTRKCQTTGAELGGHKYSLGYFYTMSKLGQARLPIAVRAAKRVKILASELLCARHLAW